jgi:3-methyladenine DNA glycosylase AlkC
MEPFKNIYNKKSITELAEQIYLSNNNFPKKKFINFCLKQIEMLEMKERVIQITKGLDLFLTESSYQQKTSSFLKTLKNEDGIGLDGFILWPYTYFIEIHGNNDLEASLNALYQITKRFTSEFGIRPFLQLHSLKTYQRLLRWTSDPCEHVRRLTSEGTRPNLPWGKNIPINKHTLALNINLLEQLKNDQSLYVKKSVANHLNDISWIEPKLVIKTLKKWNKENTVEIQWVIKRALRNLLKQGNPEALKLLGFLSQSTCKVKSLRTSSLSIKMGEEILLSFDFINLENHKTDYMIDYIIYFQKSGGKTSPKTFKLKTLKLNSLEKQNISKKISFKTVTTRTHYPGIHKIAIQVNGVVKNTTSIHLT